MLQKIKSMLGFGNSPKYSELKQQGAIILDVRTKNEFASGHIKGSINIPVDSLNKQLHQLKTKNTPIITCCASGMRSAVAKNMLLKNGYKQVFNGGSWSSLNRKLVQP